MESQDESRTLGPLDHPTRLLKDIQGVISFDAFEVGTFVQSLGDAGIGKHLRLDFQHGSFVHDDGPLNNVLQFPNVTGPPIGQQAFHGFSADAFNALANAHRELLNQKMGQQRNVAGPIAQRRHLDWKDVQTVIQILAKCPFMHGLVEISIRRCDNTNIDLDRHRAANPLKLSLLQHPQQLGLYVRGKLPDLIEEDCAAVSQLKATNAFVSAPVKAPFRGQTVRFPPARSARRRS